MQIIKIRGLGLKTGEPCDSVVEGAKKVPFGGVFQETWRLDQWQTGSSFKVARRNFRDFSHCSGLECLWVLVMWAREVLAAASEVAVELRLG